MFKPMVEVLQAFMLDHLVTPLVTGSKLDQLNVLLQNGQNLLPENLGSSLYLNKQPEINPITEFL
jgi:hypothetical protein